MCDPTLIFAILEVLTLLQRACENEYIDEVRMADARAISRVHPTVFSTIRATNSIQTEVELLCNFLTVIKFGMTCSAS